MKTAPRSAKTNDGQSTFESMQASAVPTSTGVTAAASVFGRAARSQGFMAAPPERMCVSRKSRELLEIRLPLLHVCVASFLRFLGEVVEQRRVAAEIEEAELAVAVGVHRGFQETQRHRSERQHLAAPFQRLLFELRQRDDGVDETHIERLLRVVLAAEEPDFARFFLADDAREVRRAEASVERADARSGLAEARIVGGDGQIADDVQHVASADRVAGHHRHDRFGHAANLLLHVEDVEARDFLLRIDVAAFAAHALIAAGAEGIRPFAGDDDDADFAVVAGHVQRLLDLAHRQRAKGVTHLGTIDGDLGDAVFGALVLDVLKVVKLDPVLCHEPRLSSAARYINGTLTYWPAAIPFLKMTTPSVVAPSAASICRIAFVAPLLSVTPRTVVRGRVSNVRSAGRAPKMNSATLRGPAVMSAVAVGENVRPPYSNG